MTQHGHAQNEQVRVYGRRGSRDGCMRLGAGSVLFRFAVLAGPYVRSRLISSVVGN